MKKKETGRKSSFCLWKKIFKFFFFSFTLNDSMVSCQTSNNLPKFEIDSMFHHSLIILLFAVLKGVNKIKSFFRFWPPPWFSSFITLKMIIDSRQKRKKDKKNRMNFLLNLKKHLFLVFFLLKNVKPASKPVSSFITLEW